MHIIIVLVTRDSFATLHINFIYRFIYSKQTSPLLTLQTKALLTRSGTRPRTYITLTLISFVGGRSHQNANQKKK